MRFEYTSRLLTDGRILWLAIAHSERGWRGNCLGRTWVGNVLCRFAVRRGRGRDAAGLKLGHVLHLGR